MKSGSKNPFAGNCFENREISVEQDLEKCRKSLEREHISVSMDRGGKKKSVAAKRKRDNGNLWERELSSD